MAATRIKLASSIAYTATVGRRFVGKGAPEAGKFYSRTPIEMGEFAGQGLVKAGTRIAVGDWIWPDQRLGRQELSGEPKVVAAIDEETRSATGEWLISWAQVPPPRDGDAGPAVSLDPERFGFVLLSWVHEQSGGESAVSLSDFGSGDVPLNCVLPLAEHLGSIGLLQLQADTATIALTGQGLAAAERAAEARSSSLQRAEALQNLLVEWVHEREAVEELLKGPDPDPMDFAALDAAWEEEEVKFGPTAQSQSSCGRDGLQSRLRHASRAIKSPAA